MSLKSVHIAFIVLSVGLALGFGFWGIRDYSNSGSEVNLWLGIGSLIGGGALVFYLFRFIQKMKKVNPLLLFPLNILFSSKSVWACSVCFGDPHSKLAKGVVPAVLFLIGVVGLVLGGIASIAFTWARRAQKYSSSPH